jgi:hypothetical protein
MAADSFIELYNSGATPVNISNWKLSYAASGVSDTKIATMPAGTKIASHGYYLIAGSGYTGPPAANQSFTTSLATIGSLALTDAAGAVVVDSVNWSNSVTSGVVISPALAEGGCPALMPRGRGGRGGTAPPAITHLSIFRWPDGADSDSNCADFRVQAAATLPIGSLEGATNLKVSSVAEFSPGQKLTIDTGANRETAVVASVGSAGATSAGAATVAGATVIPVAALTGFSPSDMIVIDAGANQETAVVVSTTGGIRGQTSTTISVATPLKFAHPAGAPVSGTGIVLTAPLSRGHASGTQVTGDVPTPGAPNQHFDNASSPLRRY